MLTFSDDTPSGWGPGEEEHSAKIDPFSGWEYSSGLHYKKTNETHTDVHVTSLISEPDFFIPSAAGMHYCDLLSPYR